MEGRSLVTLVFLGFQLCILVVPTTTYADWVDESDAVVHGGNPSPGGVKVTSGVKVTKLRFDVLIEDHYARTQITALVENTGGKATDYKFSQVVPDGAYISKYEMTVDGKTWLGDTEAKEQAQKKYTDAKNRGDNAALLKQTGKNNFAISVNLQAGKTAKVALIHEVLLTRRLNKYEYAIYLLPPGVNYGSIPTQVNMKLKLGGGSKFSKFVIDQPDGLMDQDDETGSEDTPLYERVFSTFLNQETIMRLNYEIVDPAGKGTFTVDKNNYFRHTFAPPTGQIGAPTKLPKRVVFVLDTSGSMRGTKWEQTKTATYYMLDQLSSSDLFNIVHFSSEAKSWQGEMVGATSERVGQAKTWINDNFDGGSTNIYEGLRLGLELMKKTGASWQDEYANIVIFLSDGEATAGPSGRDEIINMTKADNTPKSTIYSLAFGDGADYELVRAIARQNLGYERKIGDGAGAVNLLKDFWRAINAALLKDVQVRYELTPANNVESVHPKVQEIGYLYQGSELIYSGKLPAGTQSVTVIVTGRQAGKGMQQYALRDIDVAQEVNEGREVPVSRTWSMLALTDFQDQLAILNGDDRKPVDANALKISLDQKLVTPWTSMVIVAAPPTPAPTEQPTEQPTQEPTTAGEYDNCPHHCDECLTLGVCNACDHGYHLLQDTVHDKSFGEPGTCLRSKIYYTQQKDDKKPVDNGSEHGSDHGSGQDEIYTETQQRDGDEDEYNDVDSGYYAGAMAVGSGNRRGNAPDLRSGALLALAAALLLTLMN